ncbi:MAG: tetracycline resistance MFS efflux pump, partial [Paracoccaceae bacterium]
MGGKRALFFIFVTVMLNAVGIGLRMPVMPDLLREQTGDDGIAAAAWGGTVMASYALMQFLFSPTSAARADGAFPVIPRQERPH